MTPIDKETGSLMGAILSSALILVPSITWNVEGAEEGFRGHWKIREEIRVNKGWSWTIAVTLTIFFIDVVAEMCLTSKIDKKWDSGTVDINFPDGTHGKEIFKFIWSFEGDILSVAKVPSA